jgi:hypothetical protein
MKDIKDFKDPHCLHLVASHSPSRKEEQVFQEIRAYLEYKEVVATLG